MKPMTRSSSKHRPRHWRPAVATLCALLIAAVARSQSSSPQPIPAQQTPQDLVDALHAAFGEHHARAVHAKGILLEGSFTPAKTARTLSRSPIFAGATLPVIVRFSDFTGIPDIPDTVGDANPRGFAIKIRATSGDVDLVTHSFNGFPVATSDEFAVFLRAIGASGPGVAHPTPIEQFLDRHPIAKAFVTSQPPPPESYATVAYFGVNSFKFTNASGRSAFVRYRLVPRAGAALPHRRRSEDEGAELSARGAHGSGVATDAGGVRLVRADCGVGRQDRGPVDRMAREPRTLALLGTITITRLATLRASTRRRSFCPARRIRASTPPIRC